MMLSAGDGEQRLRDLSEVSGTFRSSHPLGPAKEVITVISQMRLQGGKCPGLQSCAVIELGAASRPSVVEEFFWGGAVLGVNSGPGDWHSTT